MKNTGKILFSLLVLGLFLITGCGKTSTPTESSNKEVSTVVVKTEFGDVEINKNPEKVVVFDMGSLDTINALGKSDKVVAVPNQSLPEYLKDDFSNVDSAGGIKEPDMEKINAIQPDLIIISGRQEDFREELEKIAPTIYLGVDASNIWESTKNNINALANIFGEEEKADKEITALETRINETKEKASALNQKALVTLVNEGAISAYGKGSRFGIVHDVFGFKAADENIEASTHGQQVSYEYILETNPDILFVIDRTKVVGGDETNNNISKNELVAQTNAAKNDKIISLASDVWYLAGGGIESTGLMLDDVQAAFK
ncbi:siderophore ABC transporter substrate-binding protein [Vagococcus xieshaowenii]|uniref:Siderophore ABC transporter substrate-binding protein n=1 Tax=Vagococcus xieshaowenii TaxID=2562451 RepID=A0AAJ5JLK7_9ENTE|nr:siderophore ABC transporter substrate-binding protein [Vagococcus xieshaowenii]QCA28685.1 siderophore ABC transporter substrate-binding protein [Vagococcus xieshaowenii]TFZ40507.1 siderophore ABC transporter substrate-binding protein [Vagococcus xieshaowenii]